MAPKAFVDASVMVYLYLADQSEKQRRARAAIMAGDSWTSAQCLMELAQTLHERFSFAHEKTLDVVNEQSQRFQCASIGPVTIRQAVALAKRYHYDYTDSLTLAAALEQDCNVLYSERLHSGQRIEKKLVIHNPFVGAAAISA